GIDDRRRAFIDPAAALLRTLYAADRAHWSDPHPILLGGDRARRPLFRARWAAVLPPGGTCDARCNQHRDADRFAAQLPEGLTARAMRPHAVTCRCLPRAGSQCGSEDGERACR